MITLNTWNTIPAFWIGTWKSDPETLYNAIKYAIKIWYRHIDCAWIYWNEKIVWDAIKDSIAEWIISREELFITSKLWNSFHHPDEVELAFKETLNNLQLDYLDMYLIHWPIAFKRWVKLPKDSSEIASEKEFPFENTWKAMEVLVKKWLVKDIWVSNFGIKHLETLLKVCDIVPSMNQIEVHPFLQQDELLDFCKSKGIAITAFAPLWSMDRPPRLKQQNEPILMEHPVILKIAEKHNITPAWVLIGWGLGRWMCVIPKSTSENRIAENLKSSKVVLDSEDYSKIKELNLDFRFYTGVFFLTEWSSYTKEYLWNE